MDKVIQYLKTHWLRLALLAFVLFAIGLVIYGFILQYKKPKTYVLTEPSPTPDSVSTAPTPAEQSAQQVWDSLKTIQP